MDSTSSTTRFARQASRSSQHRLTSHRRRFRRRTSSPTSPGWTSRTHRSTRSTWTRGGYQVARDPDDYPLFIAINETDLEGGERFFHRFGIPVAQERQPVDGNDGPLQVVLERCEAIEAECVDGRPVISLEETLEFAREHYATFQSALDMLDRMYEDVDTDADYRMEPA